MSSNPFAGHPEYFSNSVTSSGQIADISCAIASNKIIEQINSKNKTPLKGKGTPGLDWIVQKDTDSFYLCVEPFVELKCKGDDIPTTVEKVDQFLKKIIQPKMRDHLDNTYSYFFNSLIPEKMNLDREIIADKFFSIGNKNYYTRIFDSEGIRLSKPKIKIVVIEVKKANCPVFFQYSFI